MVLSVSVESAMECQMRVNDMFLRCITHRSRSETQNHPLRRMVAQRCAAPMSSPERSPCNHHFGVDSGTKRLIFLQARPWSAILPMAKCSCAERTIMHARCFERHLGCYTKRSCGAWIWCLLRGCASRCNGQKTFVSVI